MERFLCQSRIALVLRRQLNGRLQVSASTLQRLISGQSRLTHAVALRLSRVVGWSASSG
jgi:plasmid maintenance system antidote protein VapI